MAISLPLIRTIASLVLKSISLLLSQRLLVISHRVTYRSVPLPSNILVIGGSYAGVQLVRRLAETLPTGYRVILIGRKTHFNHLFNFPRYAVIKAWEETAFIPYDGIGSGWLVPEGVFKRVVGNVVRVGEDEVQLEDEECIPYTFLAICTGATLPLPATLSSSSKADGCAELRMMQDKIENAQRIAIVGGGAVGVQITGDVRSFYPEKEVVFVHSREWLLSGFGRVLGDHIKERYEHMGIRILLGERPVLGREGEDAKDELVFRDGSRESFDLVIPCTGQIPNSSLIAVLYPDCISATTGEIIVHSTFQLASTSSHTPDLKYHFAISLPSAITIPSNIFALGDVALTHGPKMARASFMQAEIVIANILSLISNPAVPSALL